MSIKSQQPLSGLVQKEALWSLILENSGEGLGVNIRLSLTDVKTGQLVLSAVTGNLDLLKGNKPIKARDLQPITYVVNRKDFSGKYLPQGIYIACYQVFQNIDQNPLLLSQQCVPITIDPFESPVLNSPSDNAVLSDFNPGFSWTPPVPTGIFDSLTYQLKVVEVLNGQSPTEAIEYNAPLFIDSTVQTGDSYSLLAQKLIAGKLYAWRVKARNGINYHAKTAVRTFSIMSDQRQKVISEKDQYILLLPQTVDVYDVHNASLPVRLYSLAQQAAASFVFTDGQGSVVSTSNIDLAQGENTFVLNLGTNFQVGGTYKLTVTGYNNQNYFLSFTVK